MHREQRATPRPRSLALAEVEREGCRRRPVCLLQRRRASATLDAWLNLGSLPTLTPPSRVGDAAPPPLRASAS
ncbi:hypothetical protein MTO96_011954 [Rhipicephalus appendiculatus]